MLQLLLSLLLEFQGVVTDTFSRSHELVAKYVPFLDNQYVFALSAGSLLALPLLYLMFFAEWESGKLPPRMSLLLPALTGQFSLQKEGPILAVKKGWQKYGEVFRVKVMNQGFTFVVGSDANSVLFDAHDKDMSQKEVYKFTVPVFGKNIVYDAPLNVMSQQLKWVRKGLTGAAMNAHAPKIIEETEKFFARWGDQGEVALRDVMGELTILTASRCLLGKEIRGQLHQETAEHYQILNDGMTHLSVFFPNLPTKAHRLRNEARDKVAVIFRKVIKERRDYQAAHPDEERPDDFLQTLIDSEYTDGSRANEDEITGLLLAALFAGQHTSSITSTWMGLMLLRNKDKLVPRLLEEQKDVLRETNGDLTFDALNKMDLMHSCMKETLRLYPPLILLMRKVKTAQKFKNYIIPQGDVLVACPPVTHRDPAVYKNPEEFDPDRFLPPRNEGQEKHTFIAFGGGRHSCLGEKFAFLQMKAIWSHLLRHFEFELLDNEEPRVDYTSIVAGPGNACRVRFKRRANVH